MNPPLTSQAFAHPLVGRLVLLRICKPATILEQMISSLCAAWLWLCSGPGNVSSSSVLASWPPCSLPHLACLVRGSCCTGQGSRWPLVQLFMEPDWMRRCDQKDKGDRGLMRWAVTGGSGYQLPPSCPPAASQLSPSCPQLFTCVAQSPTSRLTRQLGSHGPSWHSSDSAVAGM